jgi:dihydropteroate synthase
MGVINVTPDSFSDGGRFLSDSTSPSAVDMPRLLDSALAMIAGGAAILDVGGESTRPGAQPVTAAEELSRVMPVIERLRELDTILSLDTRKPEVAVRGIEAGVDLINDVGGARDPELVAVVAASDVGFCLMHMQGDPEGMQDAPSYGDVVREVGGFLAERVSVCRRAGIGDDRLLLDPGFGFGKTLAHNLELLRHLEALRVDDLALLAGLSRKRMIGAMTGRALAERTSGSVAAALLAVQAGADVVRVHDVEETADALAVLAAVGNHAVDR